MWVVGVFLTRILCYGKGEVMTKMVKNGVERSIGQLQGKMDSVLSRVDETNNLVKGTRDELHETHEMCKLNQQGILGLDKRVGVVEKEHRKVLHNGLSGAVFKLLGLLK